MPCYLYSLHLTAKLTDAVPPQPIHPSDYSNAPCIFLLRDKHDASLAGITDDVPIGVALQRRNAENNRLHEENNTAAHRPINVPVPNEGSTTNVDLSTPESDDVNRNIVQPRPFILNESPPTRPATVQPGHYALGSNRPSNTTNSGHRAHGRDSAISMGTPTPRRAISMSNKRLAEANTRNTNEATPNEFHISINSPSIGANTPTAQSTPSPTGEEMPTELPPTQNASRLSSSAPQTPGFAARFRLRRNSRHANNNKCGEPAADYFSAANGSRGLSSIGR
ncbi:hypothetical protein BDF19DRAFT_489709 [Syncephalis fuscata]|nr:hypothetical protein BDF19DRAFT_489709 [Syncephalis fuscata]